MLIVEILSQIPPISISIWGGQGSTAWAENTPAPECEPYLWTWEYQRWEPGKILFSSALGNLLYTLWRLVWNQFMQVKQLHGTFRIRPDTGRWLYRRSTKDKVLPNICLIQKNRWEKPLKEWSHQSSPFNKPYNTNPARYNKYKQIFYHV